MFSGQVFISNPAAIAHPYRVLLIRDESEAFGCSAGGGAPGMQAFAETTPAALTCNSLHSTFVPRLFPACLRHLSMARNASDKSGSGRAGSRQDFRDLAGET